MIAEIFARIGVEGHHLVEIGASNGEQNCTRALADDGWEGVWVEADPELAAAARRVAGSVTVLAEPAWRDTVADQLRRAGTPSELDLLVIDVDGDDLGLLDAVLQAFSPRAVVVEYNAAFSPASIWSTSPATHDGWDGTFRHGASLGALDLAARRRGYDLVHCDSAGVNAFFVRRDLASRRFTRPGDLMYHARVAAFPNLPTGHPRGHGAVRLMPPIDADDFRRVRIGDLQVSAGPVEPGAPLDVRVTIDNGSTQTLTSGGPNPVRISLHWVGIDASADPDAAPRGPLPRPVRAGTSATLRLWYGAPPEAGTYTLRATLVCEHRFWRDRLGGDGGRLDRDVTVQDSPR